MSRKKGQDTLALALLSSLLRRPGMGSHSQALLQTLGSLMSDSKADTNALTGRLLSAMLSRSDPEDDYPSVSVRKASKPFVNEAALETEVQVEPASARSVPDYLIRGSKTYEAPGGWPAHKT